MKTGQREANQPELFVLSARDAYALERLIEPYREWLAEEKSGATSLGEFCCAAALSQNHTPCRISILASSKKDLREKLAVFQEGRLPHGCSGGVAEGKRRNIVFVFPGQGSQWPGMGKSFYENELVFRETIDACEAAMRPYVKWSLKEALFGSSSSKLLEATDVIQPALIAIDLALAELWKSKGIIPSAVIGSSMGEVGAACFSGALSLGDAMNVICTRSRLAKEKTGGRGRMAVVALDEGESTKLVRTYEGRVAVAVMNSPISSVLAGEELALKEIQEILQKKDVFFRWVKVDYASHCSQMDPLREELLTALKWIQPRKGEISLYSAVTTERMDGTLLNDAYWWRNLREPVRFAQTVQRLLSEGYDTFVEVSPHPVLNEPILDSIRLSGKDAFVAGTLKRDEDERSAFLETLGALYCRGVDVDFKTLYGAPDGTPVKLPEIEGGSPHSMESASAPAAMSPFVRWFLNRCSSGDSETAAKTDAESDITQKPEWQTRKKEVELVVRKYLAEVLELESPEVIQAAQPVTKWGLKSAHAVSLANKIGKALNIALPATLFYEYPTLNAVTDKITAELLGVAVPKRQQNPSRRKSDEPIAIIGMSARFPGAPSADCFWELLRSGKAGTCEAPENRWPVEANEGVANAKHGEMSTKLGGYVGDIDQFAAKFFEISPGEATAMDPQQRMLLEVTWEALESSGIPPDQLAETDTGVFVGVYWVDYKFLQYDHGFTSPYAAAGTHHAAAVGRISYVLNLRGPTAAINTACSSSLVAIHQACQALRSGECELAIAGGSNAIVHPATTILYASMGLISSNGRCKTFDSSADGYARGEGAGAVIVKRLSKAQQDGDRILAIIPGSVINQDGRSQGLTAPNAVAQQVAVERSHLVAKIDLAEIGYIEAHGTGTELGDPIEWGALSSVFRDHPSRVAIGTVKTNLGHLEAASGIAGATKSAIALAHEQLPQHLNVSEFNPHISFEKNPLLVPGTSMPWISESSKKRRALGASAFGIAGTNAHVIFRGVDTDVLRGLPLRHTGDTIQVLGLSARSGGELSGLVERYLKVLTKNPELALGDIARTSILGRNHFEVRLGITAQTSKEALEKLLDWKQNNDVLDAPEDPRFREIVTQYHNKNEAEAIRFYQEKSAAGSWKLVSLPTYSFERKRYWIEFARNQRNVSTQKENDRVHALLGRKITLAGNREVWFENKINALQKDIKYITEHVVFGYMVFMGVGYLELGLAAAGNLTEEDAQVQLFNVQFERALKLKESGESVRLQLKVLEEEQNRDVRGFEIYSQDEGSDEWRLHVRGDCSSNRNLKDRTVPELRQVIEQVNIVANSHEHYDELKHKGFEYGESLRGLVGLWKGEPGSGEALGRIQLPEYVDLTGYWAHPALLETGLHVVALARRTLGDNLQEGEIYLPVGYEEVRLNRRLTRALYSYVKIRKDELSNAKEDVADIYLFDEGGALLVGLFGSRRRVASRDSLERVLGERGDGWIYELNWEVDAGEKLSGSFEGTLWVIFSDKGLICSKLRSRIKEGGGDCIFIGVKGLENGEHPERKDFDFLVSPHDKDEVRKVVSAVKEKRGNIDGIIYGFGLNTSIPQDDDHGTLFPALSLSCGGLLHLVQGLASDEIHTNLVILTQGAQAVESAKKEVVNFMQSSLWGLGRVIALEHPEFRCRLFDLPVDGVDDTKTRELIVSELCLRDEQHEEQVAFRNGERYVARLAKRDLSNSVESIPLQIRSDGSYVVSGGTYGLGLESVKWLLKKGAGEVVAVGRQLVQEENQKQIDELGEVLAGRVKWMCADMGRKGDVQKVIKESEQGGKPLRGVMHVAGVLEDSVLVQQNWASFERVMNVKVNGSYELHALTKDAPLDFFVMFSSTTSLLGNGGQANYAVANAFMDGLSHYRHSLGLKSTSVNWASWADVGMRARMTDGIAKVKARGMTLIPLDTGFRILDGFLSEQRVQGGVIPIVDWSKYLERFGNKGMKKVFEQFRKKESALKGSAAKSDTSEALLAELSGLDAEGRVREITNLIAKDTRSVLGLRDDASIKSDQPLIDFGVDSLMAVELRNRLAARFRVLLPPTLAFDHPTIKEITKLIHSKLKFDASIAAKSRGETGSDKTPHKQAENVVQSILNQIDRLSPEQVQELLGALLG